jgi:hypothetical protein
MFKDAFATEYSIGASSIKLPQSDHLVLPLHKIDTVKVNSQQDLNQTPQAVYPY